MHPHCVAQKTEPPCTPRHPSPPHLFQQRDQGGMVGGHALWQLGARGNVREGNLLLVGMVMVEEGGKAVPERSDLFALRKHSGGGGSSYERQPRSILGSCCNAERQRGRQRGEGGRGR
jgi:hypothetical protein